MPEILTQDDGSEPVDAQVTTAADQGEEAQQSPENDFGGDGFPDLPDYLQAALVSLARKFCEEDRYSRRLEIQECRRARFYWRGMQHLYWDYKSEGWQILGPAGGSPSGPVNTQTKIEESAVLYTTNIYQGFGLTIQAVLTQNMPSVRFEPQDPEDAADIATAQAGDRYKMIVEHNNDPIKLLTEIAYFSWTDGRVGGWTRWEESKRTGQEQEMITVLGALELKVPITADCVDDYVYAQYSNEYHQAIIKAGVPEKFRDKIKGGAAGNGQDVYERTARISVKQGVSLLSQSGDTLSHLVTRQRTWMRPAAFEMLEEGQNKDELTDIFEDGVQVRVDNGVYTGSWKESIDDHIAVCHPLPGDGQFRNGIGSSMIQVQERFNDLINITQDTYEYGLPAGWYDDELIDVDGIKRQRSRPNARYPVTRRPGEAMGNNFFFEPQAEVSAEMLGFMKEMMGDLAQFLTGAFPALFGGNTGGNDTARGIGTQRDQAMGRMGIIWRPIKSFWARVIEQAVRIGAAKRVEAGSDLSMSIPDENGQMETTQVRLEELGGKVFVYPEVDENFPESTMSKRNTVLTFLGGPMGASPMVQAMLQQPDNLEFLHTVIGVEELVIPGADSRNKQLAEINVLLKTGPIEQPGTPIVGPQGPIINPQTGTPALGPGPTKSTVAVFKYDMHAVELAECIHWINSPEGQKAKMTKPDGFANVVAHADEHEAAMQAMQPPQMPVASAIHAAAQAHAHGMAHGAAAAPPAGGPAEAPPAPPQAPA